MRISVFILIGFLFAQTAQAKITIYACEPEWAALAREIVGKKAEVVIGTSPFENPLNAQASRDMINAIRPAELVFCTGGGLEAKWLQRVIEDSNNIKIKTDPQALLLVYGAQGEEAKIVPRPHLNPHNMLPIAAEFTRRVKLLDAANADYYQDSYAKFVKEWTAVIQTWDKGAMSLKGMRVVIPDDSWLQLTKWLGLEVAGKIDSSSDLIKNNQQMKELADQLKEKPAAVIIFANYEDKKPIMWLGNKTKTKVLLMPLTLGGAANSGNLYQFYTTTINLLLLKCNRSTCPQLQIKAEENSQ